MEKDYAIQCVYDFSSSESREESSRLIKILIEGNVPFYCRPLNKNVMEVFPCIITKDSIYHYEFLDCPAVMSNLKLEMLKERARLEHNSREVSLNKKS
ncbi:hypothetical protein HYT26_01920 [Candidatus Pacearchaeota archaeon]|nr:hypothetical protein [Candidatus Pacearchaeota archaeon]